MKQQGRERYKQTKHGTAEYAVGQKIWIRPLRQSMTSKGIAKKFHQVYVGSYQVREIMKPNAYFIEDFEDRVIGVYNARRIGRIVKPSIARMTGSPTTEVKNRSVTAKISTNAKI